MTTATATPIPAALRPGLERRLTELAARQAAFDLGCEVGRRVAWQRLCQTIHLDLSAELGAEVAEGLLAERLPAEPPDDFDPASHYYFFRVAGAPAGRDASAETIDLPAVETIYFRDECGGWSRTEASGLLQRYDPDSRGGPWYWSANCDRGHRVCPDLWTALAWAFPGDVVLDPGPAPF